MAIAITAQSLRDRAVKFGPKAVLFGLCALALSACADATNSYSGARANFLDPKVQTSANLPKMRWDHQGQGKEWTREALMAVAEKDALLANRVPSDITQWCPNYANASQADRRAFWVGLMSAVAKHESTWNPKAVGGKGRYIGLMQISPATAKSYGCDAKSSAALKDGSENLSCAVEIFSKQVGKDGQVAGGGNRGIGRDWGPFRSANKRQEMAAWTKAQPFCKA